MFGYEVFSVIERNGVVGIICEWNGHFAKIMFEHNSNEVEFASYPLSAVARYRVIG